MQTVFENDSKRSSRKEKMITVVYQLFTFGMEQALSCVFPVFIFIILALTNVITLPLLPRYDWLFLIFIMMQFWMVRSGLETRDELKVITLFHIIGLTLEIFKVHMGSWSYPEEGIFKVYEVPLYSGFMYASVASYLCQAWRRLKINLIHWPSILVVVPLAGFIYLNFFTHHFWVDIRYYLAILVCIIFFRTWVSFELNSISYKMPIVFSFMFIGLFIWIAENIATFLGAWTYPNQAVRWELVHIGKVSSWVLLVIVSFLIVAVLKQLKEKNS